MGVLTGEAGRLTVGIMLRRLYAIALVTVFVALSAAPCLTCVGWQASADSCGGMDGSQPGSTTATICCAVDDAGRHGLPEASATSNISNLDVPAGPSLLPIEYARATLLCRVVAEAKLDLWSFAALHVPLRI